MAEVRERLVTVLLTLAVTGMADPEDAAQLAADAADQHRVASGARHRR